MMRSETTPFLRNQLQYCGDGKYPGTQLDGLSAGYTIRVNGYVPCLTELYRVYHCSLSTFHHGRSINLAAANPETVEIWFCPILHLNVYQSLRVAIRLVRRPLQIPRTSRCAVSSALDQRPPRRALRSRRRRRFCTKQPEDREGRRPRALA